MEQQTVSCSNWMELHYAKMLQSTLKDHAQRNCILILVELNGRCNLSQREMTRVRKVETRVNAAMGKLQQMNILPQSCACTVMHLHEMLIIG